MPAKNPKIPIWHFLRLLGAGLFVFACTIAFVLLFTGPLDRTPSWLLPLLVILALFSSIFVGMKLFGSKRRRRTAKEIQAERQAWEDAGLLTHDSFRVLRAFQVDEFEDEGSHYFLELEDRSVLYLSGQFLYEYEPVQTRKTTRARQFPCTQFTLRRHKQDSAVVDILCSGEVLEPEVIAPPFDQKEITQGDWVSEEVYLIRDKTYDQLKSEHEAKMRKRR
jgi:hypothetical protein